MDNRKTEQGEPGLEDNAAQGSGAEEPPEKPQQTVIREIRHKVEEKLTQNVEKASLADYIRLVQLEKELADATPKETKATWVDPKEVEGEAEDE